jgi:uncharacterized membrane protein
MSKKSTYYKDTMVRLIEKYKLALEECLEIIGRKIDMDLNDDKIYNALRGKEKAGEQVKIYAKEIDALENEINGTQTREKRELTGAESFTIE